MDLLFLLQSDRWSKSGIANKPNYNPDSIKTNSVQFAAICSQIGAALICHLLANISVFKIYSHKSRTTDTRWGNLLHCTAENQNNPNPKFLGTAKAYFVCHIGQNFQISLIYAFIECKVHGVAELLTSLHHQNTFFYLFGLHCFRPIYFYLFGRNRTGIVQIVLGKVRKFRAA